MKVNFLLPLLSGVGFCSLAAQNAPPVPARYQALYTYLQTQIGDFQSQIPSGGSYPTNFSAELLSANSARGDALLKQSYSVVLDELGSLQALGVRAVTVEAHFPVLYPAYYKNQSQYQAYLAFYRQVASDVHARGLKLVMGSGIIVDPPGGGSKYTNYYRSLGLTRYEQGRAEVAVTVAEQLKPDYLTVVNEPDIEGATSGYSELATVSGNMGLLNAILSALQNAGVNSVPIGAGTGTWLTGYDSFIQAYVTTPIQFVDMHIFPIDRDFLARTLNVVAIAEAAGKGVASNQSWPLKETDQELGKVSFPEAEKRDIYSFWAPVDSAFLQALTSLARSQHFLFLSPFFSSYFHAYVDYGSSGASPQAQQAQFGKNMLAGQYTLTGQAYSAMILGEADTIPPTVPTAISATAKGYSEIDLTWGSSTDNVGVAGYQVFRNGVLVGTTIQTSFSDKNLKSNATYTYTVASYDVAGNASAQAAPVAATTGGLKL